jgi:hypothetical protein
MHFAYPLCHSRKLLTENGLLVRRDGGGKLAARTFYMWRTHVYTGEDTYPLITLMTLKHNGTAVFHLLLQASKSS